jgi:hypothetical protein
MIVVSLYGKLYLKVFEFCLLTFAFLPPSPCHMPRIFNRINFNIAWDVVLVERVNQMDVTVTEVAAPVAVTG